MSASNWGICPNCLTLLKKGLESFQEEYYGKMEGDLFIRTIDEIKKRIEYIETYSTDELRSNDKLIGELNNTNVKQEIIGLLDWSPETGTSLREDYEVGIDDDNKFYCFYSCNCDYCGFSYSFRKEEDVGIK